MSSITQYQQSLEDVLIFLFFGIGAKVIILFVIPSKKPAVPRGRIILWYGLGAFWFLSGLLQVWPAMAIASRHSLATLPMLSALAPYWPVHSIAYTIWSVIIQLVLGILLLTERENLTGRISLVISGIIALLLWIFGENFGGLTHLSASIVIGSPGAALLALAASAALLFPITAWENGRIQKSLWQAITVLWGLATLWQVIHFNTPSAWHALWVPYINIGQPGAALALHRSGQEIVEHATLAVNLILVAAMAIIEVMFIRRSSSKVFWILLTLVLLATWIWGQGLGLRPAYAASLNTAPLLGLLLVAAYQKRDVANDKRPPA